MNNTFKVSLFKNFLNRETIVNCELDELVVMIRQGRYAGALSDYRCYSPLLSSGKPVSCSRRDVMTADNRIPRLCFSSVYKRRNGKRIVVGHNGLLFIEIAGLKSFDEAVRIRRVASRQPYTMLAFIGANGLSVIVVCSISQADGTVPCDTEAWRRLMTKGYRLLHYIYSSQLKTEISMQTGTAEAMCLMSADAGIYYNREALTLIV